MPGITFDIGETRKLLPPLIRLLVVTDAFYLFTYKRDGD